MPEEYSKEFNRLVEIIARLRGPEGCPWDKEQTHSSLREFLLEESYEVFDAIDSGDSKGLSEELGDLLMQIIFHAGAMGQGSKARISQESTIASPLRDSGNRWGEDSDYEMD